MQTNPIDVSESVESADVGQLSVDAELEKVQRECFDYFLHETNLANYILDDDRLRHREVDIEVLP